MIRRIKEAHFPAVKILEEFDFQSAPRDRHGELQVPQNHGKEGGKP
jgi:hypothetical protein